MAEKHVIRVSPILADDAQYKHPANIEASALQVGTTVEVFPGVYDVSTLTLDGVNIVGLGAAEDVVFNKLSINGTNTVVLENISVVGNNIGAATGFSALDVLANGQTPTVKLKRVKFSNCDFGVSYHPNTAATSLYVEVCNFDGTDRPVRANCNTDIRFVSANVTANSAFTAGSGATASIRKTVFMTGVYATSANTGNSNFMRVANV